MKIQTRYQNQVGQTNYKHTISPRQRSHACRVNYRKASCQDYHHVRHVTSSRMSSVDLLSSRWFRCAFTPGIDIIQVLIRLCNATTKYEGTAPVDHLATETTC
ncbi:hypothetical protein AA313_de0205387 [Arthrobotrys entomopaga]|nr:hypothetical protein AA313_de0205387 [Arthrobotrys entomopaga]